MAEDTVKLNRLGKPMKRGIKGQFAKGNQEGKIFGKDVKPAGRTKGSKNLMSILKEISLTKTGTGKSNIEIVLFEMFENITKMKKVLNIMEDTDQHNTREYRSWLEKYQEQCVKLSEHSVRYSGDYTAKVQTEITEFLTQEEKEIMDRMLKK